VGDHWATEKLSRTTPNWREFQLARRICIDPTGDGKTCSRRRLRVFYDQLFQNLTIFSLAQTQAFINKRR